MLLSLQIPLGLDNPQRLDYDESLRAFAVVCVRREPGRVGEEESFTSSLKLLDDKTFDRTYPTHHYPLTNDLQVSHEQYSVNSPVRTKKRSRRFK